MPRTRRGPVDVRCPICRLLLLVEYEGITPETRFQVFCKPCNLEIRLSWKVKQPVAVS